MQKHIERARRPSPDFLGPVESTSMVKKKKQVGTIVKLNNQTYSLETAIANPNSIKCCMNLEPLPKNAKTSMFVIFSLLYGKLLVVACIAFVVSHELTKCLPVPYYEAYFTFLFLVSIGFLKFVFCCLLQDSNCCPGNRAKNEKKVRKKAKNDTKKKKEKSKSEGSSTDSPQISTQSTRPRPSILQGIGTTTKGKNDEKQAESSHDSIDIESFSPEIEYRTRKTSQNTAHYGSFFFRAAAVVFGLISIIYTGLQFGQISEISFRSPCFEILRFINPILQFAFIFMQMHFIFMNARLKIHRFKFIARLGLMHIVATNICVWIKTVVRESLDGVGRKPFLYLDFSHNSIVDTLTDEYNTLNDTKTHHVADPAPKSEKALNQVADFVNDAVNTTVRQIAHVLQEMTTVPTSMTTPLLNETATMIAETSDSGSSNTTATFFNLLNDGFVPSSNEFAVGNNFTRPIDGFNVTAQALIRNDTVETRNDTCGRLDIVGPLVQNWAPVFYPYIIQYSLICAVVIFVMWRRTSQFLRQPNDVDIEHKLETILSQRASAMAHIYNSNGVDCVGASKGLFFGLLLLVGSLICMLLFFVLNHHRQFRWLAMYLADVSHSSVLTLSILAILIGICRARKLRFNVTQPTDLNDILLRVSAFGLFTYATFNIIAGGQYAHQEQNLLVLITGSVTIIQVILQLLFINDMSKRHVFLPEHDRNKPGRQIVTFLLLCNVTMFIMFLCESQKVLATKVQLKFYGESAWKLIETVTLPLCMFHRFHSVVALSEIWKNTYQPRID